MRIKFLMLVVPMVIMGVGAYLSIGFVDVDNAVGKSLLYCVCISVGLGLYFIKTSLVKIFRFFRRGRA